MEAGTIFSPFENELRGREVRKLSAKDEPGMQTQAIWLLSQTPNYDAALPKNDNASYTLMKHFSVKALSPRRHQSQAVMG